MKIIVMSDSHGDLESVKTVSELSADGIFHCGDSELSFGDSLLANMHRVQGNCDFDTNFPSSIVVEIDGTIILAVHGHEHDVKQSAHPLLYAAQECEADIVLFGHSHLYGAEMKDGVLFLNPGSTTQPRGGNQPTYAEIQWGSSITVVFKNMEHETVNSYEMKKD
jgi:hypothetical protein